MEQLDRIHEADCTPPSAVGRRRGAGPSAFRALAEMAQDKREVRPARAPATRRPPLSGATAAGARPCPGCPGLNRPAG
ncbi:hypothetical protein [Nonomuraea typhae]|uniref:Uncharacterized protein n=1 Tax=Nonomuraea typhae TaxID=2603600 RepID=A0ABW7Z3A6_9ACTN